MHHSYSWVFSLALAASFAVPHTAMRYRASQRLIVDFDITVQENQLRPPLLQIFYDQGGFRGGYTERKSKAVILPEGESKHIQLHLPLTRLRALRIDYLNGPGRVMLTGLQLRDALGTTLLEHIPAARFVVFQSEIRDVPQGLAVCSVSNADDPHIALEFAPPLKAAPEGKRASSALFGMKIFAIVALFLETALVFLGKSFVNDALARRRKKG